MHNTTLRLGRMISPMFDLPLPLTSNGRDLEWQMPGSMPAAPALFIDPYVDRHHKAAYAWAAQLVQQGWKVVVLDPDTHEAALDTLPPAARSSATDDAAYWLGRSPTDVPLWTSVTLTNRPSSAPAAATSRIDIVRYIMEAHVQQPHPRAPLLLLVSAPLMAAAPAHPLLTMIVQRGRKLNMHLWASTTDPRIEHADHAVQHLLYCNDATMYVARAALPDVLKQAPTEFNDDDAPNALADVIIKPAQRVTLVQDNRKEIDEPERSATVVFHSPAWTIVPIALA